MAERSSRVRLTSVLGGVVVFLALVAGAAVFAADPPATTSHGLSIYGDLKYGPGFKHFDYVNPDAPKGGDVRLAAIGTFDNLNPFILKGVAAAAAAQLFETLTSSWTSRPRVRVDCREIEMPADTRRSPPAGGALTTAVRSP